MNIETVNELIRSLESAGELSIREQKFLKLAEAYHQLAAENVEAKKIISECREYFIAGVMNRIRPTNEGYLHMICDTFADETPATDRIVAGIKADGVESGIKTIMTMLNHQAPGVSDAINVLRVHSSELRAGADK
ncbi:Uncharacterised protein [Klebsiella pneumoniae]|uniref:hypothetical protein n=1 Tax=Klebsiella pneumoniae TaxID=573 RepID=UPI000807CBF9|nr:hypothetical protein [Klebsiella pneumoniae]SBW66360.1 Uncharacterised protein [Klebsiella pneumoniae]SBY50257.1 Uncharacterised protein [Klebsiella pneumoniae]